MPLYRTTASLLQALDGPEQEDVDMLAVAANTAHRAAVVLAVLTVLVVCVYTNGVPSATPPAPTHPSIGTL